MIGASSAVKKPPPFCTIILFLLDNCLFGFASCRNKFACLRRLDLCRLFKFTRLCKMLRAHSEICLMSLESALRNNAARCSVFKWKSASKISLYLWPKGQSLFLLLDAIILRRRLVRRSTEQRFLYSFFSARKPKDTHDPEIYVCWNGNCLAYLAWDRAASNRLVEMLRRVKLLAKSEDFQDTVVLTDVEFASGHADF